MPLTRIRQTAIGNDSVTSAKLAHDLDLDGDFVRVPHGTTAQRPSNPVGGQMRFNTDLGTLEQYNTNTNAWAAIDSPPIISSLSYSGSNTATDPAGGETITLTGSNFKTGFSIDIGGTAAASTTFVNSTTVRFTTPAKTAGDYDVTFTNTNGLSAILTNGISVNGVPAFTTTAGNLGTLNPDVAMSTITIVAAEPDGGTLAYSVTSGALPTGLSLSSGGAITGTPTGPTSDTTTNFTITATDDEGQTNSRAFNLIVLRPVYSLALSNSVRLDSIHANYLVRDNRNIGSGMAQAGNTFTIACWVKRDGNGAKDVILSGTPTGTNARFIAYVNGPNLRFYGRNSSSVVQFDVIANNVIVDSTAWYHVMMVFDGTNSTANDTTRFYVNGTRVAQSNITTNNSASGNGANGTGLQLFEIGRHNGNEYSSGYIADYHFIWDVAKTDPYEFIADYRGAIIPKAYTGSYGDYGFHLDFADSALTSAGLGNDNAGIGDFTLYNFPDASGEFATGCVVTDTPTSNHTTLMDFSHNGATTNKGMLRSSKTTARYFTSANTAIREGKWYWEIFSNHFGTSGGVVFGLIPVAEMGRADANLADMHSWGVLSGRLQTASTPYYYVSGGSQTTFGSTSSVANGDVVGFSMDFDNHEFKIYDTSDASVIVTIDTSSVTNTNGGAGDWPWYLPAGGNETGSQTKTIHWNFGQDNFSISGGIPSGFKAIAEANRAEPALSPLTDATHVGGAFKALAWTGDGASTQAVTGMGFQPDLLINKNRADNNEWLVYDSVRGADKNLHTNRNHVQSTGGLTSFDSDGFTVNNTDGGNASGTSVAWGWKAGGAPTAANVATSGAMTANSVSLNGTLQSAYTPSGSPTVYPHKMSINTEAGFSIVEYNTGSNGDTMTVPHGLGKPPKVIWLKGSYDADAYNWDTLFQWLPTGGNYNGHLGRIILNDDNGYANETGAVPWGDTRPTNDVFTSGNNYNNPFTYYGQNKNNIAYCWTDIPGFSDMGFYRGNGNTTGPYIYTGFKPALVIIKDVSATQSWCCFDTAREDGYNMHRWLRLDHSYGENTASNTNAKITMLSNGFKIVGGSGTLVNTDGDAYVYMAFAEMPAKYSAGTENINT